ncbi:signal recognition particle [Rhizobium sp. 60-20]|uniref:signal recognition particle n=1 Tax=Rhizobium sp. 60-20 TaxID=1895819 RepID=UPI000AF21C54|nr:signal recognition particle [Rhizobium sp. 60-20]
MRNLVILTVGMLGISTPCLAKDSGNLAMQLGRTLAAEQICDLTFDPDAIANFIKKNVPENDMEFSDLVSGSTVLTQSGAQSMSASSKVAFCTQEERVAHSLGFIK